MAPHRQWIESRLLETRFRGPGWQGICDFAVVSCFWWNSPIYGNWPDGKQINAFELKRRKRLINYATVMKFPSLSLSPTKLNFPGIWAPLEELLEAAMHRSDSFWNSYSLAYRRRLSPFYSFHLLCSVCTDMAQGMFCRVIRSSWRWMVGAEEKLQMI